MVKRFNRMLKGRLYRYFTARGTQDYASVFSALVNGYNKSRHRRVGMTPKSMTTRNKGLVYRSLYGKRLGDRARSHLKVGQKVRLSQKHRPFKKGYLRGWTEEVFLVKRVMPVLVMTYRLTGWDDTPLEGQFYQEDVQPVTLPDNALCRV